MWRSPIKSFQLPASRIAISISFQLPSPRPEGRGNSIYSFPSEKAKGYSIRFFNFPHDSRLTTHAYRSPLTAHLHHGLHPWLTNSLISAFPPEIITPTFFPFNSLLYFTTAAMATAL